MTTNSEISSDLRGMTRAITELTAQVAVGQSQMTSLIQQHKNLANMHESASELRHQQDTDIALMQKDIESLKMAGENSKSRISSIIDRLAQWAIIAALGYVIYGSPKHSHVSTDTNNNLKDALQYRK